MTSRREGKHVIYTLSDPQVWDLVRTIRAVAERNLAEVDMLVRRFYTDRDSLEAVTREEVQARLAAGTVLVLDVRPAEEYAAGHLPGAMSIPLEQLTGRLNDIPSGTEIAACCGARTASTPIRPWRCCARTASLPGAWRADSPNGSPPAYRSPVLQPRRADPHSRNEPR